jgi:uncharacterized membrane protein
MTDKIVTGPVQVLVIGFDRPDFSGAVLAEFKKVRKRGVIRLVDLLFVQKDAGGNISSSMHMTDLSEAERLRLGAVAGGLIGLEIDGLEGAEAGAEAGELRVAERDYGMSADQLADLADSIPAGSAAAIMVIEHHWATSLRDALADAGGELLVQAMIGPDLLLTVGAGLEARLEAEAAIEAAEEIKYAAAVEVAQVLAEAELIEETAMAEAADVVATAIAVEDAAADEAVDALLAASLIEDEAADEAAEAVAEALAVEDEAADEAADAVEAAADIKAAAALEALRALYLASVIEDEATAEAVDALVAADIIEQDAAEEAVAAVVAAEEVADEA